MARAADRFRHTLFVFFLASAPTLHPLGSVAQEVRRVPVAVVPAVEQSVRRVLKLAGTVTAERAAQLSVATSGLITDLAVDAGDRVAAGDLLLELDAELARLQWQSEEAEVKRAAQALADARRRLEEARRLAPQQSIAETAVRDLESEVVEDEALLRRAQALAGFRKGILDRHRLTAPFPGVISARYSDIGEWVTPGDRVLDLVSTENLRLDFQVSEDYLGDVDESSDVVFYVAGQADWRRRGRVLARVPVSDPTARTFLLRVVATEPVPGMLPGMSVNAELRFGAGRSSVVVPRDAVLRYADGRTVVWVVESADGADQAKERLVETGLSFDGLIEIRRGVTTGDRVVVEGNEALRNGQPVAVREGEAT